jgi:hypothetical protein
VRKLKLNRYKKLELEKVHLRDRLKSLKCSKEIEEIKEIIALISMKQFKIQKEWNKRGNCEYE